MLNESGRLCDTCGDRISKGDKYSVTLIPRDKRHLFSFLNGRNAEIAPTFAIEANGDVRLDICLDCTTAMDIPGGETIN